jgi:hypothetical protein
MLQSTTVQYSGLVTRRAYFRPKTPIFVDVSVTETGQGLKSVQFKSRKPLRAGFCIF